MQQASDELALFFEAQMNLLAISSKSYRDSTDNLIGNGSLAAQGDFLKFVEGVSFNRPSSAAAVMRGLNSNRRITGVVMMPMYGVRYPRISAEEQLTADE